VPAAGPRTNFPLLAENAGTDIGAVEPAMPTRSLTSFRRHLDEAQRSIAAQLATLAP
jgi:hypothetical protein